MEDRVKLKIVGFTNTIALLGGFALVLEDDEMHRKIPIIIGMSEAQAIAVKLENEILCRPLFYDVAKTLLDNLQVDLIEVFVTHVKDKIFYTELLFRTKDGREIKLDSRISDAIVLALEYKCPIYATREVVEQTCLPSPNLDRDIVKSKVKNSIDQLSDAQLKDILEQAIKEERYEDAAEIKTILTKRKGTTR